MSTNDPEQLSRDNYLLTQKYLDLKKQLTEETRKKGDFQSELIQTIKKYEDEVINFKTGMEERESRTKILKNQLSERDEEISRMKDSHQQLQYQLDQYSRTIQSYERNNRENHDVIDQLSNSLKNEKARGVKQNQMMIDERLSMKNEYMSLMSQIGSRKREETTFTTRHDIERYAIHHEETKRKTLELERLLTTVSTHSHPFLALPNQSFPVIPSQEEYDDVEEVKDAVEEAENLIEKVLFQQDLSESEDYDVDVDEYTPEKKRMRKKNEVKKLQKALRNQKRKLQDLVEQNEREKRLEEYSRKFHHSQVTELHTENAALKHQIHELQSVLLGGKARNVFHSSLRLLQQTEHVLSKEAQDRCLSQNRILRIREKNENLLEQVKEWAIYPNLNGKDLHLQQQQQQDDSENNHKSDDDDDDGSIPSKDDPKKTNKKKKKKTKMKSGKKNKKRRKRKKKIGVSFSKRKDYVTLPPGMTRKKIRNGFSSPLAYTPVYFKASASSSCQQISRRRKSEQSYSTPMQNRGTGGGVSSTSTGPFLTVQTRPGKEGKARLGSHPLVVGHPNQFFKKFKARKVKTPRGRISKALEEKRRRSLILNAAAEKIKKEKFGFSSRSPRFDNPNRMYVFY